METSPAPKEKERKKAVSIMELFRSFKRKNNKLQQDCERMLKENFELLQEIRELKYLLYKDSFASKKKRGKKR